MDHSTLAGNVYEQDAGGNSTLTRLDAELAFNKETEDWKPITDSSLTYGDLRLLQEFIMGVEALPKRKAELGDGEPSPPPQRCTAEQLFSLDANSIGMRKYKATIIKLMEFFAEQERAVMRNEGRNVHKQPDRPASDVVAGDASAKTRAEAWWDENSYRFINKDDWWDMGEVLEAYNAESGAAQEVSPPSPELWETLAQAMCRNEYSASRSFDEQVTPARQLWQRFEAEAKFAIETIENAGYKIGKHGAGDTRELKAAVREVLTQLRTATSNWTDDDLNNLIIERAERLLGEPTKE